MVFSRSWVSCHFVLNIFYHLHCLWPKIMDDFKINSDIHPYNTRTNTNLHSSLVRSTKYQNGTYFSSNRIYNRLPTRIKQLSGDVNKFKSALKMFLLVGSLYSIEELFEWTTLDESAVWLTVHRNSVWIRKTN